MTDSCMKHPLLKVLPMGDVSATLMPLGSNRSRSGIYGRSCKRPRTRRSARASAPGNESAVSAEPKELMRRSPFGPAAVSHQLVAHRVVHELRVVLHAQLLQDAGAVS